MAGLLGKCSVECRACAPFGCRRCICNCDSNAHHPRSSHHTRHPSASHFAHCALKHAAPISNPRYCWVALNIVVATSEMSVLTVNVPSLNTIRDGTFLISHLLKRSFTSTGLSSQLFDLSII